MTGADVEHSAQIKFHGVILHAIDACDVRRRDSRAASSPKNEL